MADKLTTLDQMGYAVAETKKYADSLVPSAATTSSAGLMIASDKTKLNGIAAGAQVNVIESVAVNSTTLTVSNKKVTIPLATASNDGAMSTAYATKLNGIETGSQVNIIETLALEGNSGTLTPASKKITIPLATTTANGLLSAAMLMKLQGIEEGAQKQPYMEYRQSNGWLFVRRDGKLVSNAIGPMDANAIDKPAVILEKIGNTYYAHVYNYDEDTHICSELSDAEIFPLGCLKWYKNPDFSDSNTTCITKSDGTAYTASSYTPADGELSEGDVLVCRLEY